MATVSTAVLRTRVDAQAVNCGMWNTVTLWMFGYTAMLYLLTLPVLKIPLGIDVRLGQLALLVCFIVLVTGDCVERRVKWSILLGLLFAGLLLSALSCLTSYAKIKESVFVIKYSVMFPAAFYAGCQIFSRLSGRSVIAVLETTLALACFASLALHYYPVPVFIHERPAHLSIALKGSFWEQGHLAFFIGLFLVASLALRVQINEWPHDKWRLPCLYGLAIACAIATRNKAVWLALLVSFLAMRLVKAQPGGNRPVAPTSQSRSIRFWSRRLLLVISVSVPVLTLLNAGLPPEDKIVSYEMLSSKWDSERGAALRTGLTLFAQEPWLGHGFGSVESYFSAARLEVVGLGEGVAELFNYYLDLLVSSGVLGLFYGVSLLLLCCRLRSVMSVLVVTYLFVAANLNPVGTSEYYYFFMGLSYAGGSPALLSAVSSQTSKQ